MLNSNLGEAYSHAGTSGWIRPHVTSTSPATFAYATVSIVWVPSSTSVSLVLDQALFEESPFVNTYFDGNTGVSSLANLDWEGTPNLSKSQYYRNREVTEVRLNKDLPNYLTAGTTFQIYFFQP